MYRVLRPGRRRRCLLARNSRPALVYLLVGLGLVLVIEGLTYAAFPEGMKRLLLQLADLPGATLRSAGLFATIAGLVLLLVGRLFFSA